MKNIKDVPVAIIRKEISYVPIPQMVLKFGISPRGEEIVRQFSLQNKLLAFSRRPVTVWQIVCGLVIENISDGDIILRGVHRLEIKNTDKMLLNDGETVVAKAEIKDYTSETITGFSSEFRGLIIDPILERCAMINREFMPLFSNDVFAQKFDSLDAFLDRVMADLVIAFSSEKMKDVKNLFLDYAVQEAFLGMLDINKRALFLGEILDNTMDVLFNIANGRKESGLSDLPEIEFQPERTVNSDKAKGVRVPVKTTRKESAYKKYERLMREAGVPEEVKKEAESELPKLLSRPDNEEYRRAKRYLDWICSLPWNKSTEDNDDLKSVEKILNRDHYGLEEVKERILEYLAVRKLNSDKSSPILCLVGPPGTGKTSISRSVADALGRVFIRLALGGLDRESKIRGHERTYVGALPGVIISSSKKAGVNNPVFNLDEIDKTDDKIHGALMEVLDPEQNVAFFDHYINAPYDLSNFLFIATANSEAKIYPPLKDRMEIIRLGSYTLREKLNIAAKHLYPKQIKANGLKSGQCVISPGVFKVIAVHYTREAGVRNLEKEIGRVCRKVAVKIGRGDGSCFRVNIKNIHKYLGPYKFRRIKLRDNYPPGVAIGLAWTAVGGEILEVQIEKLPRKSGGPILKTTGMLRSVLKESIEIVLTVVEKRAREIGFNPDLFRKNKIHIHIPGGAVPKDGPSAGITVATALASLFIGKEVKKNLAMTGEITVTGDVLPIGGLKEKILAGVRAGIKEFIIPYENKKNLAEISPEITKKLHIHFVKKIEEVLRIALGLSL